MTTQEGYREDSEKYRKQVERAKARVNADKR